MKEESNSKLLLKDGIATGIPRQEQSEDREGIEVKALAVATKSWDNAPLPDYPAGKPEVTILHYMFPAHTKLTMHIHDIINAGMVLGGEVTIVASDGQEHTFKKGDVIVETCGKPHYGENRGCEDAEVIMFYAGAKGLPLKKATDTQK